MSLPPPTQAAALAGPVELGEFELDVSTRRLTRGGAAVPLTPKPFRVLVHLVENRQRLVTRGELLERFWEGGQYEEALTRAVSSVRKALDDHGEPARFIETRWAEGYRYIGPYADAPAGAPASLDVATEVRPARRTGGRWPMAVAAALAASLAVAVALSIGRPAATPPARIHAIAVLPLQNLSGYPENDYFTEGLTDSLTNELSRIEGLSVIARGSTRSFGADPDPKALGRSLRVPAYLGGSVRLSGGSVRVAVQLVDTVEGRVLWTFETEEAGRSLPEIERAVARGLASRLSARLRAPSAPVARTEEAYTRYLRGRHLWQQRSGASLAGAIAEFEASRTSDPVYANAHLGLAESWLLLPLYAAGAPQETYPRARVAAEEALRLDPSSARAHAVLGVVTSQFDWDWEASDRHFAQAVALNPNDATALQWQAEAQCFRGRFDECAQGLRAARELDPLSPILAAAESFPARFSRDSAAALRILLAVEKDWPDFPFIQYQLGLVYCREEKWDEALRTLEAARPSFGLAIVGGEMANVYARSGRRAEAVRLRDEMLAMSRRAYFPPVTLAAAEIGLGDLDAALAHLERAVEVHDDFLVYLRNEHHVDVLRDTPRFQAILERLGFQTSEQTARHGPLTTAGGAR